MFFLLFLFYYFRSFSDRCSFNAGDIDAYGVIAPAISSGGWVSKLVSTYARIFLVRLTCTSLLRQVVFRDVDGVRLTMRCCRAGLGMVTGLLIRGQQGLCWEVGIFWRLWLC